MRGAIAAGHPLTAAAGAQALEQGGNAVDACIAAAFASWVTESPLTGPGSGGFMLVHHEGRTRLLDFFVATPGLGGVGAAAGGDMHAVDVGFGGDAQTSQVFRIGGASCAVPGTPAGLAQAHAIYGTLPWAELLQSGIELARTGVELSRPQAHLHAILDLILRHAPEGQRLYGTPDGDRLVAGDVLRLPDLAETMEVIARDGANAIYRGALTDALVRTVRDDGGALTRADLDAYRGVWRRPVRTRFREHEFVSNAPPSSGGILIAYGLALLERLDGGRAGSAEAIAALVATMREQTRVRGAGFTRGLHRGGLAALLLDEAALDAAAARARAAGAGELEPSQLGGTTHVSVVDGEGNAASLTTSTGSGSGVIVPGTGIHLNNMLGEYDLVAGGPAAPGRRLTSMMAPSIVLGDRGPRLVVGSAGSVRLRGAIMQIVVNVLEHGLSVGDAIDAARVHVDEPHVHCEGGFDSTELDRLEAMGYDVVRWRRRNLFFGGAAAVEVGADGELAAAGDPRRGGAGVVVA